MAQTLRVNIVGDTKDLERALGRAGKGAQTFGQKVQRGAKVASLALGAGLAVAAKIGFDEMSEMAKVTAQTEAVLKSTSKAANVTSDHVRDLAESISEYSGQDDEAVQAGENMLLTFSQIRNEVGKGNDIFDQATKATADMAQALGKDMPEAAMAIGKALNNPIKGVGRLEKVGVSFSDKQKKLITRLTESGDVMGAQKVILKELNKEFGGSAKAFGETMPGKIKIAQESFRNLAGEMMTALMPAITAIALNLAKLAGFLREHPALAKAVVFGVAALAIALGVLSVASTIAAATMTAFWIASGIGLAVALAAAIVVLYMKFEKFRKVVDGVINFIKNHWKILVSVMTLGFGTMVLLIISNWGKVKAIANTVINFVKEHWRTMLAILTGGLSEAVIKIKAHWESIKSKALAIFYTIKAAAATAWGHVRDSVQWVVDKVSTLIGYVQTLIGWINKIPSIPGGGGPSKSSFGTSAGPGRGGTRAPVNPRMMGGTGGGTYIAQTFLDGNLIAEAVFQPLRNQAAQFQRTNGQAAF